jgi:hypothetical protein
VVLGAFLGFCHCLFRWRKISHPAKGIAHPSYAAP